MPKRFFELTANVDLPGCWELGSLLDSQRQRLEDPWRFTAGRSASATQGRITIPVERSGNPLDFSRAAFGTPVVHSRVAAIFTELAPQDVQLVPVDVEGQREEYFILNATRLVKCIDDQASEEVSFWRPEDGLPEKVGTYFSVSGMRIDTSRVGDAQVFRTWGWDALIVSEDIKSALERLGATGMMFKEVTEPSPASQEARELNRTLVEQRQQMDAFRDVAWSTLGTLDEDIIIPIAVGGSWPALRQRWRVIRREAGRTMLVTHGLSDSFIERLEPSLGFGLELALEVDESVTDVSKSWPLPLLERVAHEVAEHEHVREGAKAGLLSLEVSGKGLPESLVTGEGRVGVLLGMESRSLPKQFSVPHGEVRLVTVKALLPSELAYVKAHGAEGGAELARRFTESGEEHLSRASRPPVV
ncbi:imm11 family protein [Archangium lansingense]|uniref:Suppressor of fused domain protein n=1 Tax=Archangium lansingense TaxID=2995310 RepID=A0ABT4A7F5_9BACT|nr:DUF1629 domain-containing protein [Archangium lansinium]MCY1077531.1 suppressor of fused domain protein [Archangium lansinium]